MAPADAMTDAELLNHVLTLMNTKTKTALLTASCMALPLVWQWRESISLEEKLAGSARSERSLKAANAMLRGGSDPRAVRKASLLPDNLSATVAGSAAEWEAALKNPDPLQRMTRLAALMSSLTKETAPQAAEVFKRLRGEAGGSQYESEHRHFLRAWGRLDGQAALAHSFGPEGKVNSTSESLAALAGWAQAAPVAARAWLESQEPGEVSTNLALGLIDGWALHDFDAAAAYAASLPRSTVRDQFRSLLLQRALDSGGTPGAQRWFASIPDDPHNQLYKQRAFDELIAAMMKRDPSGAAAWIAGMGRQQFMGGDALPEVAARLAASSPADALRWLEGLGQGEGEAAQKTHEAYSRVLDQWSQTDLNAAGTWLQSQSAHPAYSQMAGTHAQRLAATDTAGAFAWADSIPDDATRTAARESVARAALRARGSEAHAELAAAGFSGNEIASLQKNSHLAFSYQGDRVLALNSLLAAESRTTLLAERQAFYDASLQAQTLAAAELKRAEDTQRAVVDFLAADISASAAEFQVDDTGRVTESPLPGVTANDPGCSRAHPGGAPANCAQCHQ